VFFHKFSTICGMMDNKDRLIWLLLLQRWTAPTIPCFHMLPQVINRQDVNVTRQCNDYT
jgi:hypothetical protein